ncbi:hypothetical protein DYU11_22575 [Fibrisoma montanum]|uniref:Uncharacterized protein n=1 Tax=Fibrisoma montanum TaxID=2305895 RepID=A0A418M238_9BACT|nr:hypothetical protein [Fibrisoma montanum]RIV19717.1 hypothetical protein DYU11_22575 [Fibrisoma montanum]
MACPSKIKENLLRDCNKPLSQGVAERFYIGMYDDQVSAIGFDPTNPKILNELTLKTGEKLKVYEGFDLSNRPSVGFTAGDFGNTFPHTFVFAIFDNSAKAKQEIDALGSRKDFFIIYKRRGAYGPWEVMGLLTGMKMTAFEYNPNDASAKGALVVTLTAADEPGMPHEFVHKDQGGLVDTPAYLTSIALPVS